MSPLPRVRPGSPSRVRLLLVISTVMALGAAACGPSGQPASPAAPAPSQSAAPAAGPSSGTPTLDKVIIATPGSSLSYLPAKVADEKGFFKEEGVDVEWTQMGGDLSVTAVMAGEVGYTTVPSSASAAAAQGAPIKTVEDLAGKRIGVQRQGDLTAFESKRVVDMFNVPNVTIVSVGPDVQRLAALESGAVDAIVASAPWDIKAEQQGMHVLLPIGNVLEIPQAGLATSDTKIQNDADEIAKLVRGIIRGTQYIRDPGHHDEVAGIIARWVDLSPEEASTALDRVRGTYSATATPTDAQIQLYLEMRRATGAATDSTTVDQITDFS